ncbi:hypothetical protein RB195_020089 [Necator americanus]|uniref:Uncharacterized protein n=1 Tax=Necator americanus TaxID=51031 RepID=A0ABR1CJZ3_NECAM
MSFWRYYTQLHQTSDGFDTTLPARLPTTLNHPLINPSDMNGNGKRNLRSVVVSPVQHRALDYGSREPDHDVNGSIMSANLHFAILSGEDGAS